jgi:hypothetical protein
MRGVEELRSNVRVLNVSSRSPPNAALDAWRALEEPCALHALSGVDPRSIHSVETHAEARSSR